MYSFIHDAPIDATGHARVIELLGDEPYAGLVVHLALARPEGGLRYVDVWESEAACTAFRQARLGPAVTRMLAERGIVVAEGEHAPTFEFEVVDVRLGPASAAGVAAGVSVQGLTAGAAARPS
jgi:hypothetical protein